MHYRNAEPTLEEALSEDLVQSMMKADRVDPVWLRALLEGIARRQGLACRGITGRSCGRLQGGSLGARLPGPRLRSLRQAVRLGCQKTRE
jgi:hypothetical protein